MTDKPQLAEVKPDIEFVFDLIKKVVAGKIRVPQFQRKFIWRKDQMTDFLDSIRKQYPIGSLLMWETDDSELSSTQWVGPIKVPVHKKGTTTSFLLDGQQRLSTLVGTLVSQGNDGHSHEVEDPGRWLVRYNVKTQEFEHYGKEDPLEPWHFPLQKLMDTVAFLEECQRMLRDGGKDGTKHVEDVQKLAQSFTSYRVPIIHIKNTNLKHAVEVFARLNSKGQKMSPDQMVSALTYSEKSKKADAYRLADKIDDLIGAIGGYGFAGVGRTAVLRSLLATLGQNVYETDWTRLTDITRQGIKSEIPDAVEPTRSALLKTCEFLHKLGVKNHRLLPYAMQMVVLSAFFGQCDNPTQKQKKFLRRWFWVTSFTAKFGGTNTSRDDGLVKEFRNEVSIEKSPSGLKSMRLDDPAFPIPSAFDMRSARARALLSVMLREKPRGKDGKPLRAPWEQILTHGPAAMGNAAATVSDKDLRGSPANRILKVDMKEPGQAKNWILTLDSKIRDKVLKSHAIPPDSFDDLASDDADAFLKKRTSYLIELEIKFMEEMGVTPPKDKNPRSDAIDTDS
jgi:hypothetical protein